MDRTFNSNRAGTLQRCMRALLVMLSTGASLPAHAQLSEYCVVSVLNRNVQAKADGTWVLPNIPANFGSVRARHLRQGRCHQLRRIGRVNENGAKAPIGTLHATSAACEQAKTTLTTQLQTDWNAMVARQAAHTDDAGEMRYTFTCQGGVTVEVPLGVTY